MKDSHTVAANVIVLMTRQVITWSLTAVLILYLPRYLGDSGLGRVTFATSFTGLFIWLVLLGVPTYLVKEVARDREKLASLYFNALSMRVPLAVLVFLIVLGLTRVLDYPPETKTVVYILCFSTIIWCLNNTAASVLQAIENMRWLAFAEVTGKLVVTGLGIYVLTRGLGVVAYALVLLLGNATNLAINLSYFVTRLRVRPSFDLRVWHTLLLGGLPFLITAVLATVYSNIEGTMLRLLTTDSVVGWYGAAAQLFATLNFFPLVLSTAVLPALSRMQLSTPNRMVSVSRKALSLVMILSLPMATGTVLIADKIIHALHYPAAFQNSIPLLAILSLNMPITGLLVVMGTVVTAADRQVQWAKATAIGVGAFVLAATLLIPAMQRVHGNGGIGAATASVMSEIMILALGVRLLPRGVVNARLLETLGKALAGSLLMGLVVWWARGFALAPLIGLGVLVYVVFSLLVKAVPVEDLAVLKEVLVRGPLVRRKNRRVIQKTGERVEIP